MGWGSLLSTSRHRTRPSGGGGDGLDFSTPNAGGWGQFFSRQLARNASDIDRNLSIIGQRNYREARQDDMVNRELARQGAERQKDAEKKALGAEQQAARNAAADAKRAEKDAAEQARLQVKAEDMRGDIRQKLSDEEARQVDYRQRQKEIADVRTENAAGREAVAAENRRQSNEQRARAEADRMRERMDLHEQQQKLSASKERSAALAKPKGRRAAQQLSGQDLPVPATYDPLVLSEQDRPLADAIRGGTVDDWVAKRARELDAQTARETFRPRVAPPVPLKPRALTGAAGDMMIDQTPEGVRLGEGVSTWLRGQQPAQSADARYRGLMEQFLGETQGVDPEALRGTSDIELERGIDQNAFKSWTEKRAAARFAGQPLLDRETLEPRTAASGRSAPVARSVRDEGIGGSTSAPHSGAPTPAELARRRLTPPPGIAAPTPAQPFGYASVQPAPVATQPPLPSGGGAAPPSSSAPRATAAPAPFLSEGVTHPAFLPASGLDQVIAQDKQAQGWSMPGAKFTQPQTETQRTEIFQDAQTPSFADQTAIESNDYTQASKADLLNQKLDWMRQRGRSEADLTQIRQQDESEMYGPSTAALLDFLRHRAAQQVANGTNPTVAAWNAKQTLDLMARNGRIAQEGADANARAELLNEATRTFTDPRELAAFSLRIGLPIAAAGVASVLTGGAAVPVLAAGAVGGGVGSIFGQALTTGEVKPSEVALDAAMSAVPGMVGERVAAKLAPAGSGAFRRVAGRMIGEGVEGGFQGGGDATVRPIITEGRLPTFGGIAQGAGSGTVVGSVLGTAAHGLAANAADRAVARSARGEAERYRNLIELTRSEDPAVRESALRIARGVEGGLDIDSALLAEHAFQAGEAAPEAAPAPAEQARVAQPGRAPAPDPTPEQLFPRSEVKDGRVVDPRLEKPVQVDVGRDKVDLVEGTAKAGLGAEMRPDEYAAGVFRNPAEGPAQIETVRGEGAGNAVHEVHHAIEALAGNGRLSQQDLAALNAKVRFDALDEARARGVDFGSLSAPEQEGLLAEARARFVGDYAEGQGLATPVRGRLGQIAAKIGDAVRELRMGATAENAAERVRTGDYGESQTTDLARRARSAWDAASAAVNPKERDLAALGSARDDARWAGATGWARPEDGAGFAPQGSPYEQASVRYDPSRKLATEGQEPVRLFHGSTLKYGADGSAPFVTPDPEKMAVGRLGRAFYLTADHRVSSNFSGAGGGDVLAAELGPGRRVLDWERFVHDKAYEPKLRSDLAWAREADIDKIIQKHGFNAVEGHDFVAVYDPRLVKMLDRQGYTQLRGGANESPAAGAVGEPGGGAVAPRPELEAGRPPVSGEPGGGQPGGPAGQAAGDVGGRDRRAAVEPVPPAGDAGSPNRPLLQPDDVDRLVGGIREQANVRWSGLPEKGLAEEQKARAAGDVAAENRIRQGRETRSDIADSYRRFTGRTIDRIAEIKSPEGREVGKVVAEQMRSASDYGVERASRGAATFDNAYEAFARVTKKQGGDVNASWERVVDALDARKDENGKLVTGYGDLTPPEQTMYTVTKAIFQQAKKDAKENGVFAGREIRNYWPHYREGAAPEFDDLVARHAEWLQSPEGKESLKRLQGQDEDSMLSSLAGPASIHELAALDLSKHWESQAWLGKNPHLEKVRSGALEDYAKSPEVVGKYLRSVYPRIGEGRYLGSKAELVKTAVGEMSAKDRQFVTDAFRESFGRNEPSMAGKGWDKAVREVNFWQGMSKLTNAAFAQVSQPSTAMGHVVGRLGWSKGLKAILKSTQQISREWGAIAGRDAKRSGATHAADTEETKAAFSSAGSYSERFLLQTMKLDKIPLVREAVKSAWFVRDLDRRARVYADAMGRFAYLEALKAGNKPALAEMLGGRPEMAELALREDGPRVAELERTLTSGRSGDVSIEGGFFTRTERGAGGDQKTPVPLAKGYSLQSGIDRMDRAGRFVSDQTQFRTRPMDAPLMWNRPVMKFLNPFMSFPLQHYYWVKGEVSGLKNAVKSGDRAAQATHLRTLAAYNLVFAPVLGAAAMTVRAYAQGKGPESRQVDPTQHPFLQAMEALGPDPIANENWDKKLAALEALQAWNFAGGVGMPLTVVERGSRSFVSERAGGDAGRAIASGVGGANVSTLYDGASTLRDALSLAAKWADGKASKSDYEKLKRDAIMLSAHVPFLNLPLGVGSAVRSEAGSKKAPKSPGWPGLRKPGASWNPKRGVTTPEAEEQRTQDLDDWRAQDETERENAAASLEQDEG